MNTKLKKVLLIDDNEFDNFYHKRVILKNNFAEDVIPLESAKEALDFLKLKAENKETPPELIFLDINMPGMNGWEFLEEYSKLSEDIQSKLIVVMLSTSDNPDDIQKAKSYNSNFLKDFKTKPLTTEILTDIYQKYFKINKS